eukprot:325665-Chlamydomonas_euryale.AAC.1
MEGLALPPWHKPLVRPFYARLTVVRMRLGTRTHAHTPRCSLPVVPPRRPDGTGPHIYLKREDLNHTGAHKINNSLGQALLCKRMGKERIIAETGAGQHGVATVGLTRIIAETGTRQHGVAKASERARLVQGGAPVV